MEAPAYSGPRLVPARHYLAAFHRAEVAARPARAFADRPTRPLRLSRSIALMKFVRSGVDHAALPLHTRDRRPKWSEVLMDAVNDGV